MKQLIKECRKCWILTLVLAVLIIGNIAHIVLGCEANHHISMPIFLKIIDFIKMT